jgi:hypothetical protein
MDLVSRNASQGTDGAEGPTLSISGGAQRRPLQPIVTRRLHTGSCSSERDADPRSGQGCR